MSDSFRSAFGRSGYAVTRAPALRAGGGNLPRSLHGPVAARKLPARRPAASSDPRACRMRTCLDTGDFIV